MEHRYYAVVSVPEELQRSLRFPYAASFVRVYRERCDLADRPIGELETSYYVSDLSGVLATPQALATLRNIAISVLRLAGFDNIAAGTRWVAWEYTRGLRLLGL